jgi:hypothetical protein
MSDRESLTASLSPEAAVAVVAGPNRAWFSAALIAACGIAAAVLSSQMAFTGEGLRSWACAGYGLAIGGLLSLLPTFASLFARAATLNRRPVADDPSRPWWPLVLVASALRDTPALRRTAEDFRTAVNGFVPAARGLISQRHWPACVAAFAAPVLGLVSAWVSWKVHVPEAIRRAQEAGKAAKPELTEVVPAMNWSEVAWPMIITIVLSLVLMMAIVVVDQLTRRLLQRWATVVRPLDAESPCVAERHGAMEQGQLVALGERLGQQTPAAEPQPAVVQPPAKPQPQLSAEGLQGLGEMRRNG